MKRVISVTGDENAIIKHKAEYEAMAAAGVKK
jgi:hypothetical protein